MRARALLAVAALLLAGCASSTEPPQAPPASAGVEAPWWPVGAWWDVLFAKAEAAPRTVRLVNYMNTSADDHFWLGVRDRDVALDHALHDTNPFLGRVHWRLLAPHAGGVHAMLYKFPLVDGATWESQGEIFGHAWAYRAVAKGADRFDVAGTSPDGARIAFDYDPDTQWFRELEIRDARGRLELRAEVTGHGEGATGTYWFLRGRDYYEGPSGSGTHDETFVVKREERAVATLAVEFDAQFSGPMRVEFLDPSGAVRLTETTPGGAVRKIVEIPQPAEGAWTVRYVGSGNVEGRILAVGILEYTATV